MPYTHLYLADYDAHLWILEREPRMLILRWVQAGRCHYGEQRWVFVVARRAAVCALTHARIKVGDKICRPASAISSLTEDVQILAHALPSAAFDSPPRHLALGPSAAGRSAESSAFAISA